MWMLLFSWLPQQVKRRVLVAYRKLLAEGRLENKPTITTISLVI